MVMRPLSGWYAAQNIHRRRLARTFSPTGPKVCRASRVQEISCRTSTPKSSCKAFYVEGGAGPVWLIDAPEPVTRRR